MRKIRKSIWALSIIAILGTTNITVFAKEETKSIEENVVQADTTSEENIEEFVVENNKTRASSKAVWSQTYSSKTPSVRKTLSMMASLKDKGKSPYTTIKVTNKSDYPITAIVYKGRVGSQKICSMLVAPHGLNSMTITKKQVIKYGRRSKNGTASLINLYSFFI